MVTIITQLDVNLYIKDSKIINYENTGMHVATTGLKIVL